MTVTEPGIREVQIERERNPDGSVDPLCVYRKLRIVGTSGAHIVIEQVFRSDLLAIAETLQRYVEDSWAI